MKQKIYGWHFVGKTLRDGSPIPPDGEWLEYKGICKMCESGLHFSDTPAMALQYAPGATLCYVEVENVVDRQDDKGLCTRRKILARMDATEVCYYTARMNALSVSHLWNDEDDPDDVVLNYLLTGEKRASAWDSAQASARASAWDSAQASARASAWVSARASARASAWVSARASARASAWVSARVRFNELIYECFENIIQLAAKEDT